MTLGHRRLSIVDLSPAGQQPMWTPCRRYAIIFNGEIYNHLELRAQTPVHYRGHSDTETILHYLARQGVEAARDFNGIFALGFVDMEQRRLFLVRDAFGVKPLYYSAGGGKFAFASELRPLRQFADEDIDVENLAELLRLRYLPAPDTLYKGIYKVRPGHVVEVDLNHPQLPVREYPLIRRDTQIAKSQSPAAVLDQYESLVKQAVRRQLMSDVEIGVLLSGGVDSALVASIAQEYAPYKLKAFTVGFGSNESADEIEDARETAQFVGMDHHEVRMGSANFFDFLPKVTEIVEEPLATTSVIPMFYLSALASRHVKVVLSGQGADEAMGGYQRYRGELLRSAVPGFALSMLKHGARLAGVKNDTVLRGLNSVGERDDVRRFESVYEVFTADRVSRLVGQTNSRASERIRYFFDLLQCSTQRHSVERMMSIDLRMNLADDLLLYTDKITMHHSIECRVPLLDMDLIRFVEALPHRHRVGLFHGKIAHKKVARRVLPRTITQRKKKGFVSPTATWFRESDTVKDLLLSRNSRFSSYFDRSEVQRVLDEHAAGMNRERHIFLLLGLYHWMAGCHGSPINTAASLTTV